MIYNYKNGIQIGMHYTLHMYTMSKYTLLSCISENKKNKQTNKNISSFQKAAFLSFHLQSFSGQPHAKIQLIISISLPSKYSFSEFPCCLTVMASPYTQ